MEKRKILFTGIDNSGKTSIIKFLNKELTLGETIVPTFKESINFQSLSLLGLKIAYWELGGQQQFRKNYFENKNKYFWSISLLVHVIDIKDIERYDESLNYLKRILETINEISSEEQDFPKIMILFHKLDPDLKNSEELNANCKKLEKKILNFIIFEDYSFYKTSIYDAGSLIKAFSETVVILRGKAKLIQDLLKEYCAKTFASAAMIFDKNFFIVEQRATKLAYIDVIETFTPFFIDGIEKLEDFSIETIDIVSKIRFPDHDSKSGDNQGTIFIQKIDIGTRLYLVVFSKNPKAKKRAYEYLDYLAENLSKILG